LSDFPIKVYLIETPLLLNQAIGLDSAKPALGQCGCGFEYSA
jgi:hypothetical protein